MVMFIQTLEDFNSDLFYEEAFFNKLEYIVSKFVEH